MIVLHVILHIMSSGIPIFIGRGGGEGRGLKKRGSPDSSSPEVGISGFCRPKVNSPEMLSHVARILSGEVYRETKLIDFCKIKSFCNKSRSLPYHETKQAE